MRRLPPLKSLNAFQVVSRCLSIKRAAEELCLTPAAISYQIKALEDYLGVKLFSRQSRSIALTSDGEAYAPLVREVFEELMAATRALSQQPTNNELTVRTTYSFASNWLGPRLGRFRARHPSITIRMLSAPMGDAFAHHDVDIEVRHSKYDQGIYPEMAVAWILDDFAAPVCAPGLVSHSKQPIELHADVLLSQPLLQCDWPGSSNSDRSWTKWFDLAGVNVGLPRIAAGYSDEQVCLQDAVAGSGIAHISLAAAALKIESGMLEVPSKVLLENKSYFALCPFHHLGRPQVAAFRDWLLEEADMYREGTVGAMLPAAPTEIHE